MEEVDNFLGTYGLLKGSSVGIESVNKTIIVEEIEKTLKEPKYQDQTVLHRNFSKPTNSR